MATTLPKKKRKSGKEMSMGQELIKDSAKLNAEVDTAYEEVYGNNNKLRNKILQSMQ